jgi:hypothetical protein
MIFSYILFPPFVIDFDVLCMILPVFSFACTLVWIGFVCWLDKWIEQTPNRLRGWIGSWETEYMLLMCRRTEQEG